MKSDVPPRPPRPLGAGGASGGRGGGLPPPVWNSLSDPYVRGCVHVITINLAIKPNSYSKNNNRTVFSGSAVAHGDS